MAHAVFPLADVLDAFLRVDILALAMPETIEHLTVIAGPINPGVLALARYFILMELALILRSVLPGELALSAEQAMAHFALVRVAVLEKTSALAVVDLANLTKCLVCKADLPDHFSGSQ